MTIYFSATSSEIRKTTRPGKCTKPQDIALKMYKTIIISQKQQKQATAMRNTKRLGKFSQKRLKYDKIA